MEQTYRIRPLEWQSCETRYGGIMHHAPTFPDVICAVCQSKSGAVRVFVPGDGWRDCESVEAGKTISEARYLNSLLPALEAVKETGGKE